MWSRWSVPMINLQEWQTKFKKSDDQTNIDKYRVAANVTEYPNISKLIFLRIIIPKFTKIMQLFHVNMLNCTYRLFLSQLSSCYAFYIVPNCSMNHHTEFEIDKTIITCKNVMFKIEL